MGFRIRYQVKHTVALGITILFGSWLLLLHSGDAVVSADASEPLKIAEEMDEEEKREEIDRLLREGDRYKEMMNYNSANAVYEGVFRLDPNHVEASKRIDRLKEKMLQEGRSETGLVSGVYDTEIEARVRIYWNEVQELVAQERWGQARFTLEKLLLLDPLHEEGRELYERLKEGGVAKTEKVKRTT